MFKVGGDIVVFEDVKQIVVRTTDANVVNALSAVPGANAFSGVDQVLVSLPWCEESCRILQNVGVPHTASAAPLWHDKLPLVEGKHTPMTHQLFTAAFMTLNPRCYVLNDPRTGKTGSIILAMDYLQRNRFMTGGFLIITTYTTMRNVWENSILTTIPNAVVSVAHGSKKEDALAKDAHFYITNYDSCRVAQGHFEKAIKAGRIGGIIIDELTHVGNSSSARHKSINHLTNKTASLPYIVGVTGSPAENPEMVFGMAKTVNPGMLPVTTKRGWSDLVTYQYGPEPFMRRATANAPDVIYRTLQPAVRFNKSDIIDLPPITTQTRECAMSKEQEHMREQFRQEAIALTMSGEVITAANGGVLHQKLMQTAQGFCTGNDGKATLLDYTDRLKTIKEVIEETTSKVVIFAFYRTAIKRLADDLKKAGFTVGVVDGSVTGLARDQVLTAFQETLDPRVLICHPTTTAYGVELAAADTLIFNGPPPLGGFIYAQALERLSSMKQKAASINIVRIVSSPEEKRFFTTLDAGKETGGYINDLFAGYTRGVL